MYKILYNKLYDKSTISYTTQVGNPYQLERLQQIHNEAK